MFVSFAAALTATLPESTAFTTDSSAVFWTVRAESILGSLTFSILEAISVAG